MKEREYKLTLTEENKIKVEQFLHLLGIDADIVEAENIKESEEKEQLKLGQPYYTICSDSTILDCSFDSDSSNCKGRLSLGNCFKTREEAEFELERIKVIAEMKKFAESEDREWDSCVKHWYLYYDVVGRSIEYMYSSLYKYDAIYFASKEEAQKCVDTIGGDRIKKYYFRVKE